MILDIILRIVQMNYFAILSTVKKIAGWVWKMVFNEHRAEIDGHQFIFFYSNRDTETLFEQIEEMARNPAYAPFDHNTVNAVKKYVLSRHDWVAEKYNKDYKQVLFLFLSW